MCPTSVCCECVADFHSGSETIDATHTGKVAVVVRGCCDTVEYKPDTATRVDIKTDDVVEGEENNIEQDSSNLVHQSYKVRLQISELAQQSSFDVGNVGDPFRNVDNKSTEIGTLSEAIVDGGKLNRCNFKLSGSSIASNMAGISENFFIGRVGPQEVPKKMESLRLEELLRSPYLDPPASWEDGTHTGEEPETSSLGPGAPQSFEGLVMSQHKRKLRMFHSRRGPETSSEDHGSLMSVWYTPETSYDDVSPRATSVGAAMMSPSQLTSLPSGRIASSLEGREDWLPPRDMVLDSSCIIAPSAEGLVRAPDGLLPPPPPSAGMVPAADGLLPPPSAGVVPAADGFIPPSPSAGVVPAADGLLPPPPPSGGVVPAAGGLLPPPPAPSSGVVPAGDGLLPSPLPSAGVIPAADGLLPPPPPSAGVVPAADGLLPPPPPSAGVVPARPNGRVTTTPAVGRKIGLILELAVLLLAVIFATPVAGRYDRGGPQHSITWGRSNAHNSAVFGNLPTNVTAVLGHRARLPCQVKNLGLKDVSWIRKRDLHILTVGIFTYTADERFKVFHHLDTEDWFLEISSVTFRDAGVYECQVSTSPKVSLPIHLTVLAVQQAEILGPSEVYIQHGSTISLHCEVEAGVEAVGPVLWYRGASTLNYSSPRGGISMEVEKTPTRTMSKLYITRAVRPDSGNYTCAPKFARPDSVIVHVVNAGEESAAAVQSGVEAARSCMGVVWAATLLTSWLIPTHPPPTSLLP